MGDGFWDTTAKTVVICTDKFTLEEVELFKIVLSEKFGLISTVKKELKSTNK